MITEQSIQTVVMLSDVSTGVEEDEGDEYTRCPKYWPGGVGVGPNEVGNNEGTYGKVHVKRETETSVGSFIRRTFSVTDTTVSLFLSRRSQDIATLRHSPMLSSLPLLLSFD
jgi:hypothetical protein